MNGNQLVQRATVVGPDGNPSVVGDPFSIVGIGDFDGDGKADMVWHHSQTNETQIWFMNGNQLVQRATVIGPDGNPSVAGDPFSIVGVGDLDGDGKADIVWHHSQTNETQVWFMNGNQLLQRATVVDAQLLPARVVSRDPFTNSTSQHATEVEPDTFSFGNTIVASSQVGRFFSGGSSDLSFNTSTDGGLTWTTGFLPGITRFQGDGSFARVSDPSVVFDARHGVWLISQGVDHLRQRLDQPALRQLLHRSRRRLAR